MQEAAHQHDGDDLGRLGEDLRGGKEARRRAGRGGEEEKGREDGWMR